jgi:hypothetical protein
MSVGSDGVLVCKLAMFVSCSCVLLGLFVLVERMAAHELPYGVADIVVVSTKTIDPAHYRDIALAELIEQPATLWPPDESRVKTRDPVVRHHLVDGEPC